jgi:hypothetical protein
LEIVTMTSYRLALVGAFLVLVAAPACSANSEEPTSELLSADTAGTGPHLLQGKSTYAKDYCIECGGSRPSFNELEQLGVQRAAEEDALWSCTSAGYQGCVALAVRMTSCNGFGSGPTTTIACSAQATASDRQNAAGAFGPPVQGKATYTKGYCIECGDPRPSFNDLEELGVQRAAETDAISQCTNAGFQNCAVLAVRLSGCNDFGPGPSTTIGCSAQATATGQR